MNPSSASSAILWFSGIVRSRFGNPKMITNNNNSSNAGGGGGDGVGSLHRKNQFYGVLFKYGPNSAQLGKETLSHGYRTLHVRLIAHAIWDPHFVQPDVEAFTRGDALGPVNIVYSGVY